jgi:LPS export ABC transporter permease LptG
MPAPLPAGRQPGPILYRYIAPEALRPAAFSLLGLTAMVLTRDFMQLSELVINRGLGTGTVAKLALLEAVPIAANMFPFAVLIGCLVALGRLGADREILALESLGVSGSRLVWPVLAVAGAMTLLALPFSVYVGPWASREMDRSIERISRESPWAHIRGGAVTQFGGWQLQALEANPKGDQLRGVLLWTPRLGETVFAEHGSLAPGAEGGLELTLEQGSVVLATDDGPRHVRFERLATLLPETDPVASGGNQAGLEGLTLDELAERAREFEPTADDPRPHAALLLHRRFALPAATLVFGFLAAPLFFVRRSYSRAGGGVLGLLCTGAYYGLVQLGDGLASRQSISPAAAAWLPDGVLLLLGIALFFRARARSVLGLGFERGGRERRWSVGGVVAGRRREIRIKRWPLPRYVGARFAQIALLAFAAMLMAYLVIDVMERLSWFARFGATADEALRFYATRIPTLAARVVPMALLVATALVVSLMALEGELIGMRSCGIPAQRALLPVLLITVLVAPAYFAFKGVVVPRAYELGEELKRTEIKADYFERRAERQRAPYWVLSGHRVIEAERFDEVRGRAEEVTLYELDDHGLPTRRTDAREARHIGRGVWRLTDPSSIEVSDGHLHRVPARRFEDLGEGLRTEVDTRELSIAELAQEIQEIEESGLDATLYRVDFHIRFAEAVSCIVLPAVALFLAVSGPPFPGPAQNLLVSGILGVGYILLTSVSASLAHRGTLPPALGAWAPVLLLGALAAFSGTRMMRRL